MPSYSSEVKNELTRVTGEDFCCQAAELAALFRMGGAMSIGGQMQLGINFVTENAALARKVLNLIKGKFELRTEVMVSRSRRLKKNNRYMIKVVPAPEVVDLLAALGIMGQDGWNHGSDMAICEKDCCKRAYLRGAFLGGGSVNRPEGEYHLELVTENRLFAATLVDMMKHFDFPVGETERKKDCMIYLKDGDAIMRFLRLIGVEEAMQSFEQVRHVKSVRNKVNRLVNCETANLNKTVMAATRQVACIKRIAEYMGMDRLPPNLREAASLRLAHPEAPLQELVDMTGGKVSKSGMNHRLRKLEQLAQDLPGGE